MITSPVTVYHRKHPKYSISTIYNQLRLNNAKAPFSLAEIETVMANYNMGRKNKSIRGLSRRASH